MMHRHLTPHRPRIAFVDPCSTLGYCQAALDQGGLGRTEATILRIASALHLTVPPTIDVIYNPIADDLRPGDATGDLNRLLFASSLHKGLKQVFEQFAGLRKALPKLTFSVADPGYLTWETGPVPEGVVFLGSLSHAALLRQMRRSVCLFYPQTSLVETVGLVLAETNAVGTPALVHAGLGAIDEIVCGAQHLNDGHDPA